MRKTGPFIALFLVCLVLLLHIFQYMVLVDDSFISYRYAENMAYGKGLVFNEGERVEGYTNFLFVILLSLCFRIGLSTPLASQFIGVAFALAIIPLVYRAGRACCGLGRWTALLPCAVLASSASLAMWAGAGMETTFYAAAITFALYMFLVELRESPRFPWAGVLFALAALVRPEGAGMFCIALFTAWALRAGAFRPLLKMLGGFAAVFLPHLVFRLIYYGYPLPNTFYAKTSASADVFAKGAGYSLDFFMNHGIWALAFIAALPLLSSGRERRLFLVPLAVAAFASVYIMTVGGDFYEYSRFYIPYLPWFVLMACAGAWKAGQFISERWGVWPKAMPALLVIVLAVSCMVPAKLRADREHRAGVERMRPVLEHRREFGDWLREHYPRDTVIAVSSLGIIPYYAGLPVIDMLGLVDEHIAHGPVKESDTGQAIGHFRYDPAYVLSREPDLVIVDAQVYTSGTGAHTEKIHQDISPEKGFWKAPYELTGMREFRVQYEPKLAVLPSGLRYAYFERAKPLPDPDSLTARGYRNAIGFYDLGKAYRVRGLYPEAVAALRHAAELSPDSVDIRRLLASSLFESERFRDALKEYRVLFEYSRNDPEVNFAIGYSLFRLKEYRESIRFFQRFMERARPGDPNYETARESLQSAAEKLRKRSLHLDE